MIRFMKSMPRRCGLVLLLLLAVPADAQLPVSGVPVPQLSVFDSLMQSYMSTHGITAGVLGVSRFGVVVYQRGFGTNVPKNTPMRLASVEKPLTAAAIRQLIADGLLNWNDRVFNLPQCPGGILTIAPWQQLGDTRLCDITIMDLVNHQGGWDRATAAISDPQFRTREIAEALGISSPAGRNDIIRYMLSQPLQFTPGTNGCQDAAGNPTFCYSNFGYMVLGRVIEQVSGTSHLNYIRTRILTPAMWIPNQEILLGRSLGIHQSPREPAYQCSSCNCISVFNPDGPRVPCPYGGWHQEAFVGHGNFVASAAPLLAYMDSYRVAVQAAAGTPLPPGTFGGGVFNGALDGTSTCMWQRGDGINITVLFTRWGGVDHAAAAAGLISDLADLVISDWPTFAVDGFWVDFQAPTGGIQVGGYNHPFRTMAQAISVGAGAKVRLKPGSTNWTGQISHQMRLDAPFGAARIGQ